MELQNSEAASKYLQTRGLTMGCPIRLSIQSTRARGNLWTSIDLALGVDLTITDVITHNSLQCGRDVVNLFMTYHYNVT